MAALSTVPAYRLVAFDLTRWTRRSARALQPEGLVSVITRRLAVCRDVELHGLADRKCRAMTGEALGDVDCEADGVRRVRPGVARRVDERSVARWSEILAGAAILEGESRGTPS